MEPPTCPNTRFPQPRRIATEPAPSQVPRRSLSVSSAASRSSTLSSRRPPDDAIETLYNHPSVKIIAFTASQGTAFAGSDFLAEPKPGSLRPSSQLERTIAVGPFRIYRAPGSVAFLSCGSALQPILPKSQCWCIEEANSRFVLQIRRPQYWRLEVPLDDPEHVHRASVLREVLDSILLFEKTECPFERSFTVELPERPDAPVKKKPWTPVGKNLISSPFVSNLSPAPPAVRIVNEKRRRNTTLHETRPYAEARIDQFADQASPPLIPLADLSIPASERGVPVPRAESSQSAPGVEGDARSVSEELQADVLEEQPHAGYQVQIATFEDENLESSSLSALEEPGVQPRGALQPIMEAIHGPMESLNPADSIGRKIHSPATGSATVESLRCLIPGSSVPDLLPCSGLHGSVVAPGVVNTARQNTARDLIGGASTVGSQSSTSHRHDAEESKVLVENITIKNEDGDREAGEAYDISNGDHASFEGAGSVDAINLKKKRMSRLLAGRSVTFPPQLSIVTSPPSESDQASGIQQTATSSPPQPTTPFYGVSAPASPSGSVDSFHSVESWHSPTTSAPPSPPSSSPSPAILTYLHEIPAGRSKELHNAAGIEVAPIYGITPSPGSAGAPDYAADVASSTSQRPFVESGTKALYESQQTEATNAPLSASPDCVELHHGFKTASLSMSRRTLSPLPPASALFSSTARQRPSGRMAVVRQLPGAIIHKTMEILLSPPGHLVNLMLQVAAKIAAGEWRGLVFGLGEGGESIPVHWDYSDGELSAWEDDDDYTLSIGRFNRPQAVSTGMATNDGASQSSESSRVRGDGRGWEVG